MPGRRRVGQQIFCDFKVFLAFYEFVCGIRGNLGLRFLTFAWNPVFFARNLVIFVQFVEGVVSSFLLLMSGSSYYYSSTIALETLLGMLVCFPQGLSDTPPGCHCRFLQTLLSLSVDSWWWCEKLFVLVLLEENSNKIGVLVKLGLTFIMQN